MWAALARSIRRVFLVLWVIVLVGFGPSQAWAGVSDPSSSTVDVATSTASEPESSSPEASTAEPSGTDSSTATSEPSPTAWPTGDSGGVLVELEPSQWAQLTEALDRPAPEDSATLTAGTVVLDEAQWEALGSRLDGYAVAAVLLVLVTSAATVAAFGGGRSR